MSVQQSSVPMATTQRNNVLVDIKLLEKLSNQGRKRKRHAKVRLRKCQKQVLENQVLASMEVHTSVSAVRGCSHNVVA